MDNPKYRAVFPVTLSVPTSQGGTVDYEVVAGTAQPEIDYAPGSGTLAFGVGETSKEVRVDVRNIYTGSPAAFKLRLSNPVGLTLARVDGDAVMPGVTIRDLFLDTFTNDSNLIDRIPDIGQAWLGVDQEPIATVSGGKLHFADTDVPGGRAAYTHPAETAAPDGGNVALTMKCSNIGLGSISEAKIDFEVYDMQGDDYRWATADLKANTITLGGNTQNGQDVVPFDFTGVTALDLEIRWELDTGYTGYYVNGTLVFTVNGVPAIGALGEIYMFVSGFQTLDIDDLRFQQGVDDVADPTLLFSDDYSRSSDPISTRTPKAGTYDLEYYEAGFSEPRVLAGRMTSSVAEESSFGIDGLFAAPVTIADGVLSLKAVFRDYQSTNIIDANTSFDFGLTGPDGGVGGTIKPFVGRLQMFSQQSGKEYNVQWPTASDVGEDVEFELRWNLANDNVAAYVNGNWVHTIAANDAPVATSVTGFWVYANQAQDTGFARVEVRKNQPVPEDPVAVPPVNIRWYAAGKPDALWTELWSERDFPGQGVTDTWFGGPDGAFDEFIAARVVAPEGADVQWFMDWQPAAGATGSAPTLVTQRGPDFPLFAVNPGSPVTDAVATYSLGAWIDQAASAGHSVGILRLYAEVDGVPVPNYIWMWMAYQVDGGQSYQLTPVSDGQVTTPSVGVGFGSRPPTPPTMAWYGSSQYGSWSGWNPMNDTGTQDGAYPGASYAGRILDESLTGEVVWTARWNATGGSPGRPVITSPKGPNPADVVAGNVDWAFGVDVDPSSLAGEGFGELTLTATVGGVRVPGYLWATFSDGPQSYSTMAWGWSPGEPDPEMIHTRDDFDGAANATLAGRIPNISASNTPWNTLGEAPNAAFQLSGDGLLRPTAGTEGTPSAYGGLDLPASSTAKVEFVIRSVAGGPLVSANTHIFRVELSLGSNNAKAWLDDGFAYVSSSNTGDHGEEVAVMPGAAGAPVKVTIEWANQLVTMKFNDVLITQQSTFYSEQYPGNPDGSGTFYLETTVGNYIEFMDILQQGL